MIRPVSTILLLFVCASAWAQDENTIRDPGPIMLGGEESQAERSVFIVRLKSPSAAEYHAKITPAAASAKPQPGEQRTTRLEKNSAAIRDYTAKLESEQRLVLSKAGPGARKIYSYKYGLNGLAVEMTKAQAQKLQGDPDVLGVWPDEIRPLATTHSPEFLGLYDAGVGLRGAQGLDREGVVVGVIDGGIAPEHPALADTREADRPSLCKGAWAEATILGRWLCRRYDKMEDVVAFDPRKTGMASASPASDSRRPTATTS